MADSLGMVSVGLTLAWSNGAYPTVGTYTNILEIKNVDPITARATAVDVTHQTSTSAAREFRKGLIDWGEIRFTGNAVPDISGQALGMQQMITLMSQRTLNFWKLTLTDATADSLVVVGFLMEWGLTGPLDNGIEIAGAIKITGLPVLTVA